MVNVNNPSTCVDSWMSERFSWDADENNWSNGLGHFSQCIWSTTQRIGIGSGIMNNNRLIIVCNYDPPGNILGQSPLQ
jgi:pathogenesis-related protein 1